MNSAAVCTFHRELLVQVCFKFFRSSFMKWEALFTEAAAFASKLLPERLITISHSESGGDSVVTVWYWDAEEDRPV
jgi:hypothetical protein